MGRYRKRPVIIEAVQFTGDNLAEIAEFTGYVLDDRYDGRYETIVIWTLEGDMEARVGDFIIRGVNAELYPCKPDVFEATYEAIQNSEVVA